jgi:hypothetical protein
MRKCKWNNVRFEDSGSCKFFISIELLNYKISLVLGMVYTKIKRSPTLDICSQDQQPAQYNSMVLSSYVSLSIGTKKMDDNLSNIFQSQSVCSEPLLLARKRISLRLDRF